MTITRSGITLLFRPLAVCAVSAVGRNHLNYLSVSLSGLGRLGNLMKLGSLVIILNFSNLLKLPKLFNNPCAIRSGNIYAQDRASAHGRCRCRYEECGHQTSATT